MIVLLKYPSHHLNTYNSTREVMALDKRKCVKNGKGVCVCVCRFFFFLYTLYADGSKHSALTKRGTQWQQGSAQQCITKVWTSLTKAQAVALCRMSRCLASLQIREHQLVSAAQGQPWQPL